MSLYLALSCLQGRPVTQAFDDLVVLKPDGIQLTPGNVDFDGFATRFAAHVRDSGMPFSVHHSFAWTRSKIRPWHLDGDTWTCSCEPGATVHPPMAVERGWLNAWLASPDFALHEKHHGTRVLETMYPSAECYGLADERSLDEAMAAQLPLAVDVSHLWIQRCAGALSDDGLKRVLDYERIAEIHVSANHGQHDTHEPLTINSFGLAWARERMSGTRVVLECGVTVWKPQVSSDADEIYLPEPWAGRGYVQREHGFETMAKAVTDPILRKRLDTLDRLK